MYCCAECLHACAGTAESPLACFPLAWAEMELSITFMMRSVHGHSSSPLYCAPCGAPADGAAERGAQVFLGCGPGTKWPVGRLFMPSGTLSV